MEAWLFFSCFYLGCLIIHFPLAFVLVFFLPFLYWIAFVSFSFQFNPFVFRLKKKTSCALLPSDWMCYWCTIKHDLHGSFVGRLLFPCKPTNVINALLQRLLISEINAVCDETWMPSIVSICRSYRVIPTESRIIAQTLKCIEKVPPKPDQKRPPIYLRLFDSVINAHCCYGNCSWKPE